MKTLKSLFLFLLASTVLFSCSSDDEDIKSSEAKILKVTIGSSSATINEAAKTIAITMPNGTDKSKLTPTISISEKATVNPGSGAEVNFTNPVTYTVTAEDGGVQAYVMTVTVEDSTQPGGDDDPTIISVTPTALFAGETITITGTYFLGTGNEVILTEGNHVLTIVTENASEIKVSVPGALAFGDYTLKVNCGEKSVVYTQKIEILDPTAPVLLSLANINIVKGLDDLLITGQNLGVSAKLYFQKKGSLVSSNITVTPDNGGTTVRYTASGFGSLDLGEYDIWLEVGGIETNKLSFTLKENTNPIPNIIVINNPSPCKGQIAMITVSGFDENDVEVHLIMSGGMYFKATILDKSAAYQWIEFRTENIPVGESFEAIEVVSRGQIGRKDETFMVNNCPNPVYTSISPASAVSGTEITISGNNFSTIGSGNNALIVVGGVETFGSIISETEIVFTVPENAVKGVTDIKIYNRYGNYLFLTESGIFTVL